MDTNENLNLQKSNINYLIKLSFTIIILILFFWWIMFFWKKTSQNNDVNIEPIEKILEDNQLNKNKDFVEWKKFLQVWEYEKASEQFEKTLYEYEPENPIFMSWTWSNNQTWKTSNPNKVNPINKSEKLKNSIKKVLSFTYSHYWNYYYKENDYWQKIETIIKTIPDYNNDFYALYELGYAYEIRKKYKNALGSYEEALKLAWNNKTYKSIIINQIWHVLDLQGNLIKAFEKYREAYILYNKNYPSSVNIGRYLVRAWKVDDSIKYFEYWLNTKDRYLKSEIYFTLSSIELEKTMKPNLERASKLAQESIKNNKDSTIWYTLLAKIIYTKNNPKNYQNIDDTLKKAIKIYPNNYSAYELLALNEFDVWHYKQSMDYFTKATNVIKNDMRLMDNERASKKINLVFEVISLWFIAEKKDELFIKMLNEWKDKAWVRLFLRTQLSRTNKWVLSRYSNNPQFNEAVKKFNLK